MSEPLTRKHNANVAYLVFKYISFATGWTMWNFFCSSVFHLSPLPQQTLHNIKHSHHKSYKDKQPEQHCQPASNRLGHSMDKKKLLLFLFLLLQFQFLWFFF